MMAITVDLQGILTICTQSCRIRQGRVLVHVVSMQHLGRSSQLKVIARATFQKIK